MSEALPWLRLGVSALMLEVAAVRLDVEAVRVDVATENPALE